MGTIKRIHIAWMVVCIILMLPAIFWIVFLAYISAGEMGAKYWWRSFFRD